MHRHPRSAKILYLLKGRARVLGPAGVGAINVAPGTAVFLPVGYPHVIENMGRQTPAVFLQAFSPPGPERVYRDPKNPEARIDFEVIRNPRIKAPAGAKPRIVNLDDVKPLPAFQKGSARILLEEKNTDSATFSLTVLEFPPGTELPRHAHTGASELLYVLSGGGKLTVGSETMPFGSDTALYIPPEQPHAAKIGAGGMSAVQIYAPAGPEQRFRGAAPPASGKQVTP
jgi:mannose-6-phosphate isomerase-like protein (cupin superfamily)